MKPAVSERSTVLLVAAVQFVNILDFMMVMPMGPDFARALHIPTSELGLIGGSYTAAASVSGLAGSLFLDRYDRRKALAVAMFGLMVGTVMGGLATGLATLMAARVIAGAFGGPATSLALSIIADVIPPERRGKAMGTVMTSFSIASVLGVPAGLELARHGGWRTPFFAVGAMGLVLAALAVFLLPPLRGHLDRKTDTEAVSFGDLFRRPVVLYSYVMTATAMMGAFILIPNISAYIQQNLGYPREHIGRLYLIGGCVSFAVLQFVGRLVDRYGSVRVALPGTITLALVVYAGFVAVPPWLPVLAVFIGFMGTSGFRNVAYNTLTSKVPRPAERARFMSIQSAVQHAASAAGAVLSSRLLVENAAHRLEGMRTVALVSIALMSALPPLMFLVERKVEEATGPRPS